MTALYFITINLSNVRTDCTFVILSFSYSVSIRRENVLHIYIIHVFFILLALALLARSVQKRLRSDISQCRPRVRLIRSYQNLIKKTYHKSQQIKIFLAISQLRNIVLKLSRVSGITGF